MVLPPPDYVGEPDMVFELRKAVYGLRQAPLVCARVQVNLFIGQQLIRQQPHDLATTSINLEQTRSILASGRIRLESDITQPHDRAEGSHCRHG
ncbi:hypothetical protein PGTUg99_028740 [Puccinia graminis f. sp. tritici]|uniref:Uncharacterized protein n=1 Tax=Puccinia graminis f. sp. tritici TaxID=56615 RepID=A0A5B0SMN9_PUCGR|nr:hypothetical protein PGTUg99_028740 [Puccinia graminis f. sp. tritici]